MTIVQFLKTKMYIQMAYVLHMYRRTEKYWVGIASLQSLEWNYARNINIGRLCDRMIISSNIYCHQSLSVVASRVNFEAYSLMIS